MTQVLSTTAAPSMTPENIVFTSWLNNWSRYDNIRVNSDSMSETVTYQYNTDNEMVWVTDYNGLNSFGYDAFGRQVQSYRSGGVTTYSYAYDSRLVNVTSTTGTNVDYGYGGDGKRRYRQSGTDYTWYNWGGGSKAVSEEAMGTSSTSGDGDLTRAYLPGGGEIAGSDPSTGTKRYYAKEHLGSTRGVFDASKVSLASFEHTPLW